MGEDKIEKTEENKTYELKDIMNKLNQMENSFKSELKNINNIIAKHEAQITDHDFKIAHLNEITVELEKSHEFIQDQKD